MKISFDDKSFIDIKKEKDKIVVVISAKDHNNSLKNIINCVELSVDEYKKLISDV